MVSIVLSNYMISNWCCNVTHYFTILIANYLLFLMGCQWPRPRCNSLFCMTWRSIYTPVCNASRNLQLIFHDVFLFLIYFNSLLVIMCWLDDNSIFSRCNGNNAVSRTRKYTVELLQKEVGGNWWPDHLYSKKGRILF